MSHASDRQEAFADALLALEVDAQRLRSDPQGHSWLPPELKRCVAEDPACARELAQFVELELELYAVDKPSDAFFTRRVLERLPTQATVDARRRTWILASAYALAIGVAYLLLGPLMASGELAGWLEPLRAWYQGHAFEAAGLSMGLGVALMIAAAALVLLPTAGGRRSAGA